jgi:3-oxoacyl-[acyl-carrier protein] reductase
MSAYFCGNVEWWSYMDGRTVLVTGAAPGLGATIAELLAADNTQLIGLHYNTQRDDAVQLAGRIRDAGVEAVLLPFDLAEHPVSSSRRLVETFLDAAEFRTGKREVHVVVNNAGATNHGEFSEVIDHYLFRLTRLNLGAPMYIIRALLPHLASKARVINIATGTNGASAPYQLAYEVNAVACVAMAATLAPTLAERGATITAILPDYVNTEHLRSSFAPADWPEHPDRRPVVHGIGTAEEIARTVKLLASDDAPWITNQLIEPTSELGILGGPSSEA